MRVEDMRQQRLELELIIELMRVDHRVVVLFDDVIYASFPTMRSALLQLEQIAHGTIIYVHYDTLTDVDNLEIETRDGDYGVGIILVKNAKSENA